MRLPCIAAALAATLPWCAVAAGPADPAAAPPLSYRSVFEGVAKGVEEGTVDWRKANADVGQFPRGHADILRWEQSQGAAAPSSPAAPASAPAPAAAPRDHRH